MAKRKPRRVKRAVPVAPTERVVNQRRGLRMRIHADGAMDIKHLMTDGGMFAPGLVELADGYTDKPVWIQIAKAGRFNKGGPFELNAQVFSDIIKNFDSTANKLVPIDFEHASESDPTDGAIPTQGAPAQGWITKLEMRDNGSTLWALVEWLPLARDYIKTRKYRFFSPAIRFNARDRNTGEVIGARLTSGALTNNPFLDGMMPLAARDFGEEPLTTQELKDSAVTLSWDIEGPHAPRLPLDVNVLQAMEGIRDVISAILPCEYEEEEEEDEPPSVPSNPLPQPVPQYQAMSNPTAATLADKEPVITPMDTITLTEHETKLNAATAELKLTLKEAESKIVAAESKVAALEAEIVTMRDADKARVANERVKRVDVAFDQYKDSHKLTDLDKELMSVLIESKPELFEKKYPVISAQTQILSARVSQERPKTELPAGVERPNLKLLTDKYIQQGLDYDQAFTKAFNEFTSK